MTVNINAGNISGIRLAEQGSDPATPASGFGQLFAKADGLYFIGDDGVVEGPMLVATGLLDWTPTITQGVDVTFTNEYSKYQRIGNIIYAWFSGIVTSAGTTANDVIVGGLPGTPVLPSLSPIGVGYVLDNGVGIYTGAAWGSGSSARIRAHLETNDIGSDPSFALASTDEVKLFLCYPIA